MEYFETIKLIYGSENRNPIYKIKARVEKLVANVSTRKSDDFEIFLLGSSLFFCKN